eukprot:TRINITY_DN967_c0_g1_i1.p1 TRINITY_DN967_c0_g1~~TRINITY_DN967_c0_g1_i1.p1  ORF type:complete len:161 (-),score=36.17 TRINITY_DN967_c0_g1_i1:58-540(-)
MCIRDRYQRRVRGYFETTMKTSLILVVASLFLVYSAFGISNLVGKWEGKEVGIPDSHWNFNFTATHVDVRFSGKGLHQQYAGEYITYEQYHPSWIDVNITEGVYKGDHVYGLYQIRPHHTTKAVLFGFNEPNAARPKTIEDAEIKVDVKFVKGVPVAITY